jgi:hypothetical protein
MITPSFPRTLYVSGSSIEQYESESWDDVARDPRGLVLMWSPPHPRAKYIMGCDPTVGISGWSRATRTDGDRKTDNAAIEIFEVDGASEIVYEVDDAGKRVPVIDPFTQREKKLYRDLQVCEYAAPIDAVEVARVCNILGRIYAGSEDDQCELIWEAYPGPGMLTTQELLRLGYGNVFHWQYIDSQVEDTNRLGWRSTRESQKILWYRSRRHLLNRQALIRSKFLLEEYANAEIDMEKMRARAAYGYHDDRFQAANMCFWAAHKWTTDAERTDERVTETPQQDYQRYAPGLDDYVSYSQWKEEATSDWD